MSYIPPTPRPPGPTPPPVLLGRGGCAWCGAAVESRGAASCCRCRVREQGHRQRMNRLAEREAELRIKVLEQQLGEHTDDTEGTT